VPKCNLEFVPERQNEIPMRSTEYLPLGGAIGMKKLLVTAFVLLCMWYARIIMGLVDKVLSRFADLIR
jgi:hypothetical protein